MKIWTDEERAQVTKMMVAGVTYTESAKVFGTTRNAISGLWKRIRDKPVQPNALIVKVAPVTAIGHDRLKDGKCRYPFGTGPYTFCGAKCKDVYCEPHMAMCYNTPKDAKSYAKNMEYWA